MEIPTEDIHELVESLARYANAFDDRDEAAYLIGLRDELRKRVEESRVV